MSNILDVCKRIGISPKKYTVMKNSTIVSDEEENKVVIKKKWKEKKNLYQYLDSRDITYYPKLLFDNNEYEVYPYIEEADMPIEQKALDLINTMSLLHRKTTFYKEVNLDRIKAFYEEKTNELNYLYQYYQTMQSVLEKRIYPSPSEYILLRNSSFFYQVLSISKDLLEEWYHHQEQVKKERNSLVHHNLTLDHYRKMGDGYFISWDKADFDIPIYDFYSFYQNNPTDLDYMSLLEIYEARYPLLREEEIMLFILLLIPKKIVLQKCELSSCYLITTELQRLQKVYQMVLKKYQKNTAEQK